MSDVADWINSEEFDALLKKSIKESLNPKPNPWIITDGENLYAVDWRTFEEYCMQPNQREKIIEDIKSREQ